MFKMIDKNNDKFTLACLWLSRTFSNSVGPCVEIWAPVCIFW